jgi:Uma2 family endonuclease
MSPAPSVDHQRISRELTRQFSNYLINQTCEVFNAPFDLRLSLSMKKDEDIKTVVQPDITVVCDKTKLDDKGCIGSPDIIIEILSPTTASKDLKEKFFLYEKHGVKEYWIIYPNEKVVYVYSLDNKGKYTRPDIYTMEDKISVKLLGDLEIDLSLVFRDL